MDPSVILEDAQEKLTGIGTVQGKNPENQNLGSGFVQSRELYQPKAEQRRS